MLFRKRNPTGPVTEQEALEAILRAFMEGDDALLAQLLQSYRGRIAEFGLFRREDASFQLNFMDSPVEPYGALRTDLKIAIACATGNDALLEGIATALNVSSADGFYPRDVARRLCGAPLDQVEYGLRQIVTALSDEEADDFDAAIEFGMEREAQVRRTAQALVDADLYPVEDSFTGFGLLLLNAPEGIAALEILMQAVMAERDKWHGSKASLRTGLLPYVLPVIPAYEACKTLPLEALGKETQRALSLSRFLANPVVG